MRPYVKRLEEIIRIRKEQLDEAQAELDKLRRDCVHEWDESSKHQRVCRECDLTEATPTAAKSY